MSPMSDKDITMFKEVYGMDLVRLEGEDTPAFNVRLHQQLDAMSLDRRHEARTSLLMWLQLDKMQDQIQAKKGLGIYVGPMG